MPESVSIVVSRLTKKYQATIPAPVRDVLRLAQGAVSYTHLTLPTIYSV